LHDLLDLDSQYSIRKLEDFDYCYPESMGSEVKGWYAPKAHSRPLYLFKIPNEASGESFSEKIAFEVASFLGIPAATVDFCLDHDSGIIGNLSRSFIPRFDRRNVPKNSEFKEFSQPEMVLGNQIMHARFGDDYASVKFTRKNRLYTVSNIRAALESASWNALWPHLLEYIYFDCLIGNLDRHHENWSVMVYPRRETNKDKFPPEARLAPSYGHGASLNSSGSDEKKERLLQEKRLDSFYKTGKCVIHTKSGSRATLSQLLNACLDQENAGRSVALEFARKLSQLTPEMIRVILERVPPGVASRSSIEFTYEYLLASRQHILRRIYG